MEAALRENRMTLEAIRVTQSDRDLFKHLISEATNYVAADYMRHANERRIHLDKALEYRRELYTSRKQLAAEQYKHVIWRVNWVNTTVRKAIWKLITRPRAIT